MSLLLCSEQVIAPDFDVRLLPVNNTNSTIAATAPPPAPAPPPPLPMECRLNTARPDPIFLNDRCLTNLLKAEEKYGAAGEHGSYFVGQKDITPDMRKIVAEWMMEVSGFFFQ